MHSVERRRTFAEPNMVPLIDVALILVIIFMVLTPILVQSQLTVKLPKAENGSPSDAGDTVTVEITKGGSLTIDGTPARWPTLERELTLKLPRSAKKTLLVQADRLVPVEKVVIVLDVAKKLGVGKLGIGVIPSTAPQ